MDIKEHVGAINMIIQGDCLLKLKELADESVDAVVSDPPYELGFMGKKWDASGIAYNVELWKEAFRVLKSGGHLLAFGGTRTYHRMAVAIEDAGFEVRDMLEWIYASGFPKSLNVGKAVDKLQGNAREVVGKVNACGKSNNNIGGSWQNGSPENVPLTKGNSEWEGFGTALKPAHEPIIMARKPLSEKTIVEQVIKHGTGAIDIDGTRIPTQPRTTHKGRNFTGNKKGEFLGEGLGGFEADMPTGRFPANIICTDDALNDGVISKSNGKYNKDGKWENTGDGKIRTWDIEYDKLNKYAGDSGSKSRYFDIDVWAEKHGLLQFPKASKRERNEGCEGLESKLANKNGQGLGRECSLEARKDENGDDLIRMKNHHPTVKPVHLMSWLVRLVSKEGDTVLDPFMGSGTTGVACKKLKREFIGIELNEEYIKIAEARIQCGSQLSL